MRRCVILVAFIVMYSSCGGKKENKDANGNGPATNPAEISKHPDYQKGLDLIAASDCLTCHKIDEKINGPSYRDVANRYENHPDTISYLADKIVKGGKGNWGEVYMTPHSGMSQADAEAMVKYIMLLKN